MSANGGERMAKCFLLAPLVNTAGCPAGHPPDMAARRLAQHYGIRAHFVLLLTFVFEGGARSGSSPSASAQYISASFRHWRLCRRDFATTARRANFFAFAR